MKRLPIKFFGRREIDNRRTEGGGGNPPSFVLHGDELFIKAEILQSKLKNATEKILVKKKKNSFVLF